MLITEVLSNPFLNYFSFVILVLCVSSARSYCRKLEKKKWLTWAAILGASSWWGQSVVFVCKWEVWMAAIGKSWTFLFCLQWPERCMHVHIWSMWKATESRGDLQGWLVCKGIRSSRHLWEDLLTVPVAPLSLHNLRKNKNLMAKKETKTTGFNIILFCWSLIQNLFGLVLIFFNREILTLIYGKVKSSLYYVTYCCGSRISACRSLLWKD